MKTILDFGRILIVMHKPRALYITKDKYVFIEICCILFTVVIIRPAIFRIRRKK